MTQSNLALADVTYRATCADGAEVVVHLKLEAEAATVADAWSRLTATFKEVDPLSLEIEVRELGLA